jgi:hypothetical protein
MYSNVPFYLVVVLGEGENILCTLVTTQESETCEGRGEG